MAIEDLREVVEIERECQLSEWRYDGYEAELTNRDALVRVAIEDDAEAAIGFRVLGFLAARFVMDEVHITNIAVRQQVRRRGIGNRLLDEAIAAGLARRAVWVSLEVRESNEAAQGLYAGAGFDFAGKRKDYYRDPSEDAVVMGLKLV